MPVDYDTTEGYQWKYRNTFRTTKDIKNVLELLHTPSIFRIISQRLFYAACYDEKTIYNNRTLSLIEVHAEGYITTD